MMEWHSPNKVGVHTKKANTLAIGYSPQAAAAKQPP
jgi:hypothetical protein